MSWQADYDVYSAWPNPYARPSAGFAVEFIGEPTDERLVTDGFEEVRDASLKEAEYVDDRTADEGLASSIDVITAIHRLTTPVVVEAYTPSREHWGEDDEGLNKQVLGWGVTSRMKDRASDYDVGVIDGIFLQPGAAKHVEHITAEELAVGILSSLLHTCGDMLKPFVIRNQPASARTLQWLAKLGFQAVPPPRRPRSRGGLSLVTAPHPGYEFTTTPYKEDFQRRLAATYPFLENGESVRRLG